MKVGELIEKLKKLPQNVEAVIPAAQDGANPVEFVIKKVLLKQRYIDPHYEYGQYVNYEGDGLWEDTVLLGSGEVDTDL